MLVLEIVGGIMGVIVLFFIYTRLNELSIQHYNYEFFSNVNLLVMSVGYWCLYFGNKFQLEAVANHGDVLNGKLMIFIGILLVLAIVIRNFLSTPFLEALVFTGFELLLCLVVSFVLFYVVMAIVATALNTKPVYSMNSRNDY